MGLINVCKTPGMSSHEVVSRIRRLAGMKRVGHTGTLDPAACGVLPICLGAATRLAEYIAAGPKSYRAEILLGVATVSGDADDLIIAQADASHLTEAAITQELPTFTGVIQQYPPLQSAVQIGGRRAYDMARKGEDVVMPLRKVTVYAFTPVRLVPGVRARLLVDIVCSRGTYIRSLARDLGEVLGVGGSLGFLARTQVGTCVLQDSVTLDELTQARETGELACHVQPPDRAIEYISPLRLPETAARYQQGTEVRAGGEDGLYRVYIGDLFAGLGQLTAGLLRPVVNLRRDD